MDKQGFFIDTSACTGCKTCQIACQDRSNLEPGHRWRRIYEIEAGDWHFKDGAWDAVPVSWYVSVSCNHCSDPACVKACPTGAMHMNKDGIVLVNQDICMGCSYCYWACPYDAPRLDKTKKKMSKCDFCYDRLVEGLNPVCVDACPMRAIDFGPLDMLETKYGEKRQVFPLPDPDITNPSLVLKTHRSSVITDGNVVVNREEVNNE